MPKSAKMRFTKPEVGQANIIATIVDGEEVYCGKAGRKQQ